MVAAVEFSLPYRRPTPRWDRSRGILHPPGQDRDAAETRVPKKPDLLLLSGECFDMADDGASGSSGLSDVEKMMMELVLREDYLDDVVFNEKDAPPELPRWVALIKVTTNKNYS